MYSDSTLAPGDSVSCVGDGPHPLTDADFLRMYTQGNEARPRPPNMPRSVLWDVGDVADDPNVDLSPSNPSRPPMKQALRHADGSLLTKAQYDAIIGSGRAIREELLKLPRSSKHAPKNSALTKTYFRKHHLREWRIAVAKIEVEQPLTALCSGHWKAEQIIANLLRANKRKKKKKKSNQSDSNEDEDSDEDEDDAQSDRAPTPLPDPPPRPPRASTSRSQHAPIAPRQRSVSGATNAAPLPHLSPPTALPTRPSAPTDLGTALQPLTGGPSTPVDVPMEVEPLEPTAAILDPPLIITEPPTPAKRDRAPSDLTEQPTATKRARASSVTGLDSSEEVTLPTSGLSMLQVDFSAPLPNQPGGRKYEVGFIKVNPSIDNLIGEQSYIML